MSDFGGLRFSASTISKIILVSVLTTAAIIARGQETAVSSAALATAQAGLAASPPPGVAVFELHDPGLMPAWTEFLANTPMHNGVPIPQPVQLRMQSVVSNYRALTSTGRPAFFVATYFDLLSEQWLRERMEPAATLAPMTVCPVFRSGDHAPARSLLATVSNVPEAVFVDAPGLPERGCRRNATMVNSR
ncbi:MAG: hypothetical protein P8172_16625 [Gammaproteobacteria bacterium]